MWLSFIILALVAIMILILGYQIKEKQQVKWVHSYHYRNVKPEDLKAYTYLIGVSLYIISFTIFVMSILSLTAFNSTILPIVVLVIGFGIAFVLMNKAQKKYNGGWFS